MLIDIPIFAEQLKARNRRDRSDAQSSRLGTTESLVISTSEIQNIIFKLKSQHHRDSTRNNYYAIWKTFNKFFIRLYCKPTTYEDRLTLFVGHLVHQNKKASTVKSYISAIRAVLFEVNVELQEDETLLMALTKACKLRNDTIKIRLPIQRGMLAILMNQLNIIYDSQPYLRVLYRAMLITAYFGLFRISKLAKGAHPVLARDVHIGRNKKKMLFILRTSKTHGKGSKPQLIKISSSRAKNSVDRQLDTADHCITLPCPFEELHIFLQRRGTYDSDSEPFFIFRNKQPVTPNNFRIVLRKALTCRGFDQCNYNTHSLCLGRSCDLYKLGLSVESIKKLGRWKSNVVFHYLRS